MLKLHYPVREKDVVLPVTGTPEVRIRPQPDGTYMLTNIKAGHTAPIASFDRAVATAERIMRVVRAGAPA
jgi:hypothetical protein